MLVAAGLLVLTALGFMPSASAEGEDGAPPAETTVAAAVEEGTAEPYLHSYVSCQKYGIEFELINGSFAEAEAEFLITVDGSTSADGAGLVTVPVGTSVYRVVHIVETTTPQVKIVEQTTGQTLFDQVVVRDCTQAEASVDSSAACAEGSIVVNLANLASSEADVDLRVQAFDGATPTDDTTVTLAPGATDSLNVGITGEGATRRIVVTAITDEGPGREPSVEVILDQTITRDCVNPGAAVTHDCADGSIVVSLTNAGGAANATYAVVITDGSGTVVDETVVVAPDATETVSLPTEEGETYTVTVTEAGQAEPIVDDQVILVDCVRPGATLTHTCADGDIVVTLTNTDGSAEAVYDVVISDTNGTVFDDTVTVAGNGTETVTVNGVEGETYTVTVTEATEQTPLIDEQVVSVDCVNPGGTITHDCVEDEGDIVITLTNDGGESPVTYRVLVTDSSDATVLDTEVAVAGDATEVVRFTPTEDETYDIVVTSDSEEEPVAEATITVDCQGVESSSTTQSTTSTTLGTTTSSTTGSSVLLTSTTRATEVLGTQLPRTGDDIRERVMLAVGITLIGAGLVIGATDRRRYLLAKA